MIITKRDIESFLKKECFFQNGTICLDEIQVECFIKENALHIVAPKLSGLFQFYARQKKHVSCSDDTLIFKHPLVKFEKVEVHEDHMEITFK